MSARADRRRTVLAARLLLLAGAAAAVAGSVWIRLRADGHPPAAAAYVCPMHPEVKTARPGACPICRMALEPAAPRSPSARLRAQMSDLAAVENVRKHNVVDFVRRQTPLFNAREMRGPAWADADGLVTAVFYRDQIAAMASDEIGRFSATRDPARAWPVRRADLSVTPWDSATATVRFRARPSAAAPPPGSAGWLELARRPREMLTVPAAAVVQSPEGPYVLVAAGGLTVQKRPIEIGETFFKQGFAVVLSGLQANERVVSRATFFFDADRRLAGP